MISFTVSGLPKGQPRPRAFARKMGDKFVARVYDDGTAENWKSCIAVAAKSFTPASAFTGAVSLTVQFRMPRLKAHFKRDGSVRPDAPLFHISKPDSDNLQKAVLDALTQLGGFWRDDSQVAKVVALKTYGLQPGCDITINELA